MAILKRMLYFVFTGLVAILMLFGILGTLYYTSWFQPYREQLILTLDEVLERAALPYHIARLSAQEPDTRLLIPIQNMKLENIADTWGGVRSGGRTHEGVDMFAKRGTPVFSSTYGYVIRSGVNELGGNSVFVVGKGGVRYYYAHLDSIAQGIEPGEEVTTDTVLGYVGNTGNATSTPPHLHFGMYKNGAQNPYSLLSERP